MVALNFDDTFELIDVTPDFSEVTFYSPQKDGTDVSILLKIKPHTDDSLPNVYNLGFGPPDGNGGIDDLVNLKHTNSNKVFSTILLHALTFLKRNRGLTIGIDGSDDYRVILYHTMFKSNREYLSSMFKAFGVDWYVRIFRNGNYEADSDGQYIAKPKPESFDYRRNKRDLYRYYMFNLV